MFKHVQKFTKELREFDSSQYDPNDMTKKYRKRGKKDKRYRAPVVDEEEEYEIINEKVYHCKLCDMDVSMEGNKLDQHMTDEDHVVNVEKFKVRYTQYIKMAKKLILRNNKPRALSLRKLRYFKALYNYE